MDFRLMGKLIMEGYETITPPSFSHISQSTI